jgi:hypothetical protein
MSEAFVNQVTLDCLLNKHQYETYVNKKISKSLDKKEKEFYKKRILKITKDFLSTDENLYMLPEVKYAFDNYIKACIHSFKVIDNNEIIQSEYSEIDKRERNALEEELESSMSTMNDDDKDIESKKIQVETDSIFARSTIKIINPSLDNFVTVKNTQIKEDIIFPKQKEINLNDVNFTTLDKKPKNNKKQ